MKFLFTLFISCFFIAQAQAQGFLRADGKHIVNERNEPVILRGMGLGGWMLQEGYMLQVGNLGQQHVIKGKIQELIDPEKTTEFYDAWLANHVTKADIDAMATWGFNSVRLPMHYNLFTLPVEDEPVPGKNTWLDKGFALTDQLLAWCKANNMYLILDLHAAPGGQGNDLAISDRDPNKPSLWDSAANQQKTVALWKKLAERYKDEPWIGAYDIINEPNWGFTDAADKNGCKEQKNEPLKQLLVDVTKAIRAVDSRHMIIVEGNCWGNNYNGIMPLWDDNMVVSFHKYWNDNTPDTIEQHLQLRDKYNVPLWLGESGENSNVWFRDAIQLVESHGIGWAFWPLKKLGFNNPLEVKPNPGFVALVDYWHGRGPKPTARAVYQALMQLAREDIRFENSISHPDVVDAMLRQPHDDATRPYKIHSLDKKGGKIAAVDYDMGRNGYAWFDTDVANYHVSTGAERSAWNHGRVYRNDGVDIAEDTGAAQNWYVNRIDTSEWLQYTVRAASAGNYRLRLRVSAETAPGKIAVSINNDLINILDVPVTGGATQWKTVDLTGIPLMSGNNVVMLRAEQGGYNLSALEFIWATN